MKVDTGFEITHLGYVCVSQWRCIAGCVKGGSSEANAMLFFDGPMSSQSGWRHSVPSGIRGSALSVLASPNTYVLR